MNPVLKNLHYPVGMDQGLGKVAEEPDYEKHVKQLIMQVLLTNPGDRVNRPDFGCGIRRMVFSPNDDVTASLTQVTILQALNKWLGSLIITHDVSVRANNEKLQVSIAYSLKSKREPQYLNMEVTI